MGSVTLAPAADRADVVFGGSGDDADNLAVFSDVLHPGSDVRVVRSELQPLDYQTAEPLRTWIAGAG